MRAEFLAELWGEGPGYGEIRSILPSRTPGGKPDIRQDYFELDATGLGVLQASTWSESLMGAGRDVYFGVLPRLREEGTNDACPPVTSVLWADIDGKRFPTKDVALFTVNRFLVTPQILVDSGHGYHAYWLLSKPEPTELASHAMRGIARTIGGDNVADPARVLRVPGTRNYKSSPVDVRLLRLDISRRYRFSDFSEWVELSMDVDRPKVDREIPTEPVPLDRLPEWLRELIEQPTPRGGRSEKAFKACLWLIRYGWSEDEIEAVFETNPQGIGEKYHERRDGRRWLAVTLRAAREAA